MRKLILFIPVFFLSCLFASAQVEFGNLYTELSFGKRFFYYNSNVTQVGVTIGLDKHNTMGSFYSKSRYNSYPSSPNKSYTNVDRVGLSFSHYRYFNGKTKWGWYGNAQLALTSYNLYQNTTAGFVNTNGRYAYDLTITPGVFFHARPGLMLFANIGGVSADYSKDLNLKLQSSFAGQLNLGIRLKLGRIIKKNK